MTRAGMRAAAAHGASLPRFASPEAARAALFAERDEALRTLRGRAGAAGLELDESIASLTVLERWHRSLGRDERAAVEPGMGYYFGAVSVRQVPGAEWVVDPFFLDEAGYEIGVRAGPVTVMVGGMCLGWAERPFLARWLSSLRKEFERSWFTELPARRARS